MKLTAKNMRLFFSLAITSLLVLFAYYPSFSVPFMFDDISSIVDRESLYASGMEELFRTFAARIIPYITFKLNYLYDGLTPASYHFVNLFLHFATSGCVYLLVYLLVRQAEKIEQSNQYSITKQRNLSQLSQYLLANKGHVYALIATAIFALHPLQTQAVTYVVQRITVITALFYLMALIAYTKCRLASSTAACTRYAFLAFIFTIFSCFSKQSAFTIPLSLFLIEMIFFARFVVNKRLYFSTLISIAAVSLTALYFLLSPSYGDMWDVVDRLSRETSDFNRMQYLETQLGVIFSYFKLFIYPVGQQVEYVLPISDGNFSDKILHIISYTLIFIMSILSSKRLPLVSFALFFYFAAHLVESSVIPISDLAFEHRTYLPNISLAILFAVVIDNLAKYSSRSALGILIVAIVLSTALTYQRNIVWSEPISMYQNELEHDNAKPRIHHMLAKAHEEQGKYNEALSSYEAAYRLVGERNEADNQGFNQKYAYFNNYITALRRVGKTHVAIEEAEKTLPLIKERKLRGYVYSNLGFLYLDLKMVDKSENSFYMARTLWPKLSEPLIGLAIIYSTKGQLGYSKTLIMQAEKLDPTSTKLKKLKEKLGL